MSHTFNYHSPPPASRRAILRMVRYSHKTQSWQVQDKRDRKQWRAIRVELMYAYKAIGFERDDDEGAQQALDFNPGT